MNKPIPRRRRGANAIEFALVMPVLVAILAGVADYGWYFHKQIMMTTAVRDAVRSGATTPQDSAVTPEDAAEYTIAQGLTASGYDGNLYLDVWRDGDAPDQIITVAASYPYQSLVGFVPVPDTVHATLVMRMEDQPEE